MRYQNDININNVINKVKLWRIRNLRIRERPLNGILMLVLNIIGFLAGVGLFIFACVSQEDWLTNVCGVCGVLLLILSIICVCGFILVEPGQARVLLFFGKYRGTFTEPGYYWLNPFISQKKLSLCVRNLDAEPIKVNDKTGNPIMIGMVLVWKLKDTYKAIFEIDTQTMAEGSTGQAGIGASAAQIMNMLDRFVQIQADAALRQVAGQYAYDDDEGKSRIRLRFEMEVMKSIRSWRLALMSDWQWQVSR